MNKKIFLFLFKLHNSQDIVFKLTQIRLWEGRIVQNEVGVAVVLWLLAVDVNGTRPVAGSAAVVQVLQSLFSHFRSVFRVILGQEACVLHNSLFTDVASVLVLVECAGIPQNHAAGLHVEHSFLVSDIGQIVTVNELPVLCSTEPTRLDVFGVKQVRTLIDNQCSRLVFGDGDEALDTLEVAVVGCLVSVCPNVVDLLGSTRDPAAAVEAGD